MELVSSAPFIGFLSLITTEYLLIQDKPFLVFFGSREGGNEGMGCDGQRQEE